MYIKIIFYFSFFSLMLIFPSTVIDGTKASVNLLLYSVIPALLPTMIVSSMLTAQIRKTNINPLFCSIIISLLCGCPIGALTFCDFFKNNKLICNKTTVLMAFTSNLSPFFIINYILINQLHLKYYITYLIIFYIPIVLYILYFFGTKYKKIQITKLNKKINTTFFYEDLNESIYKSFEIILYLCGYIIIFNIISRLILKLAVFPAKFLVLLSGLIEITSGIPNIISEFTNSFYYVFFLMTFSGLSCIFQVKKVLNGSYYSIKKYICYKLLQAVITTLLLFFITYVSKNIFYSP